MFKKFDRSLVRMSAIAVCGLLGSLAVYLAPAYHASFCAGLAGLV